MPTSTRKLNFTKAEIEALPPAAAGRDYYADTKVRGLQLVVTATGSKTYYFYGRIGGKPARHRLGIHPALTPENARRLAEGARGRVATGVDIRAERKTEQRNTVTLDDAFEAFKRTRRALRAQTLYSYERYIELAFKEWKTKPLVQISKDLVARRHKRLSEDHGPAYADGAMRVLRAIINVAQFQYEAPDGTPLLPDNPVRRLSQTRAWNRVARRTSYIKPTQLKPWINRVLLLKADPEKREACAIADWLLVTLFTGLRRNEGLRLPWADVDLDNKTLTVRDTKNHLDHTLPLSDYLIELLAARRKAEPEAVQVFASYGAEGYLVDPRKQLERIVADSGVTFTPHDLRRTFITVAESLDIPAYALKRLLNHKMSNDITAGYIITDVERLRKPMQQVTDFILRSAGLKPSASVSDIAE
ncbi:MAG: integrase family protein, partial [Steroidobacteraceae bacterium]